MQLFTIGLHRLNEDGSITQLHTVDKNLLSIAISQGHIIFVDLDNQLKALNLAQPKQNHIQLRKA